VLKGTDLSRARIYTVDGVFLGRLGEIVEEEENGYEKS
jgi:sporulation protein YlmC with PRC-barrel domain